ncbi:class I SAM-dependent methyltransferase [Paracraurococcus lichenis]|uniref:Methyltransferase domain-containing protein n=1 Tax=Paracraurococcus lichenis TaxID=3064888 RepID=A0ABT9DUT2_9PROT|nr:methyltransferase domain-containing protein [Paracraurococcus sp. LOR1-02]MDO9707550.1 methyltransferase domain-containing protein [Paracraurococcus sp. LOR1-02]
MQVIRTTAELDGKIEECNRAEAISDDAMRAVFGSFRMDPPVGLPPDPFSEAYRQAQLALYRDVAGRDYAVTNEVTAFDVEAALRRPFPFYTGSAVTTGEQLMAIGFLLRAMALPPGSRVVEFGPGWGNTTLALAKLGHQVTAVDIEPHFCELIRRRAAQEGVEVEVVQDDFLWAERCGRRFDAALFYECFHHCADHLRLLRALGEALAPEGRIFFAGEPITPDFPMPWGLRLDGNSLWAIRKNGWLELGFREDYFARALAETGWHGLRRGCADPDWMTVWEARRRDQPVFRATGGDPRLQTQAGRREGDLILLEGRAGTGLYGPYITLPAGTYLARLRFRGGFAAGRARMDVACRTGSHLLAERQVDLGAIGAEGLSFDLPFGADREMETLEVRLFCEQGFQAAIEHVEILPR